MKRQKNPKLEKWMKWLKVIHDEVQDLVVTQRTHREVGEIVAFNPALPHTSEFYEHLGKTYTSHVVIGMRRQVKISDDQISMAGLFAEMIESPECFTRSYFVGLYKGSVVEQFADRDFDKYAAVGAPHIDPMRVETDLQRLRNATADCEKFADRRVAHRDRRALQTIPTYAELDLAISCLDQLYVKYHLLFHAANMDSLLPTRQYDWTDVFRVPWIATSK
jgi:hypothetical protein